jgi:regulatory protein
LKRRRSRRPPQDSLFSSADKHTQGTGAASDEDIQQSGDSPGQATQESQFEKAREIALRFIARRMRTSREIADKLASKGFERKVIAMVIEKFNAVGLIDDAEYANAFLRTSLKLSPKSYKLLKIELIKKGVTREVAANSIKESSELVSETEIARRLLTRARRRYVNLPAGERRRKLFSFLARRGFSADVISELLGEHDSSQEIES